MCAARPKVCGVPWYTNANIGSWKVGDLTEYLS